MKKILSVLLVASLLCAMFIVPSSAASATVNTAADIPHLETAPEVDGVVEFNEYGDYDGLHSFSANGDQFTDDGVHNSKDYIEDISFYIGWTNENLHMAWVVTTEMHTPFEKGTYTMGDNYATITDEAWPETEEAQAASLKFMWYFSCVQFIITPGAPNATSTTFEKDKNFLSIGFCEMDDGSIGKALWNTPYGIDTSDFDYNDWEAAVVRDDAAGTTTYEIAIPAEMCGVSTFGTDATFGLGYAVAAQEHYYKKGASMVEWQDSILSWPGKADQAGVMTFKGGDGSFETDIGDLKDGDITEVEDDTVDNESIVGISNFNTTVQDGGASVMTNMEVSYNDGGNSIAGILLAPTEDLGYYTVVGKGETTEGTIAFSDDVGPVATDGEGYILIAVDDANEGFDAVKAYNIGDLVGVWGLKFDEETGVPTGLLYKNASFYISEYASDAPIDDPSSDVPGDDTSDVPGDDASSEAPSDDSSVEDNTPNTPNTPNNNTNTNTNTNTNNDDSDDDDSNVGLIIGIVVAVIAVAAVVVVVLMKKKKA